MHKLNKFLLAVTLAAASLQVSARDVSMVTVNWQPYYGDNLKDGGVITDIVTQAFARGGHKANISFIPWTRALKTVEEGDNDIVMGAYYNDERAKTYVISKPFYRVLLGLIARRDAGVERYESLNDLRPYRIGVSRGYANTEAFDAADFLNKDVARNATINIQKLQRKRIDMMTAAFGIFRYELNQVNGNVDNFVFLDPPLADNALYIMASRKIPDGTQLIRDFDRGLREIQSDGTYEEILRKHGF